MLAGRSPVKHCGGFFFVKGTAMSDGRFLAGNSGGPGNPHAGQVAKLRSAMLAAVTEEQMRAVIDTLTRLAIAGDLKACELLLNRVVGKIQDLAAVPAPTAVMSDTERREVTAKIVARLRAARALEAAEERPAVELAQELRAVLVLNEAALTP